jgi:hypothetical protein
MRQPGRYAHLVERPVLHFGERSHPSAERVIVPRQRVLTFPFVHQIS